MLKKFVQFLFNRLNRESRIDIINSSDEFKEWEHDTLGIHSAQVLDLQERNARLTRENGQLKSEALAFNTPVAIPTQIQVVTETRWVTRFTEEVYDYFEKQFSNTLVSGNTTDIEAGFKLGIQHVLQKLRAGYVVPSSK